MKEPDNLKEKTSLDKDIEFLTKVIIHGQELEKISPYKTTNIESIIIRHDEYSDRRV
jgi:hypothetical protein